MTWTRLDDRFPEHPKVVGISNAAFRLHVTALCYASRYQTEGHLPPAALRVIGGRKQLVQELVNAQLWELNGQAWLIHDYLDYNPSREQLQQANEQKRIAGAKGAAMRWSRQKP